MNGATGGPEAGDSPEAGDGPAGPPTKRRKSGWRRGAVEWGGILVVAVLVAFLLRTFVVQPYFIPSGSMEPTLKIGDKVLVDKLSYHMHSVHRGDVIVFKRPADDFSPGVTDLIKRVIGLPGETISMVGGQVYIDGKAIKQKWLTPAALNASQPGVTNELNGGGSFVCANQGVKQDYCVIPKGHYYVMGDNRGNSDDSRFIGPISGKLIVGRAFLVVWPLSHFKTL